MTYAAVGASGAVVDLLTLAALLHLGVVLPVARAISIAAALTWNFSGNERLTFDCQRPGRLRRFANFALACSLGATINYGVSLFLPLFIPMLTNWPLPTALLGIIFGSTINFLLARHWVFAITRQ